MNNLENKRIEVNYNGDSYNFIVDYGLLSNPVCSIYENDNVFVELNDTSIIDSKEIEQRKQDMIENILKPMFGNKSEELVDSTFEIIPSAFKKAEKFIIDNDLFVENFLPSFQSDDIDELNKGYLYRSVYDEGLGTVSFYIKSQLFDDEIGIIIYTDGSFYPVISTKHIKLTEEAKKLRLQAIKELISKVLNIKINFGTTDGINALKLPNLYSVALAYSKENSSVQYTDEKGDIYPSSEVESEITKLDNIRKV